MTIDRASPEPYYLQLVRLITETIANGEYAVGDRLPSELELCRRYDLSRSTVRETFRHLESTGQIKLVQRRGAFVCRAEHPGWLLQFAGGFSESEAANQNREIWTKVLGIKRMMLPADACEALKLPRGSTGIVLERLRWVEGRLALFARNHLIDEVAAILGDGQQLHGRASLNRTLRRSGWTEAGARRSLTAVSATSDLAAHLEVERGAPLLLVRSVTWNAQGRPYDYYTSWLNSDVVDVAIEVSAMNRTALA